MQKIKESYKRIGDDDGCFDIEFWQEQGDIAIFNAAAHLRQLPINRDKIK